MNKGRFNAFYLMLYAFIFKRWKNIFKIYMYLICILKVLQYLYNVNETKKTNRYEIF